MRILRICYHHHRRIYTTITLSAFLIGFLTTLYLIYSLELIPWYPSIGGNCMSHDDIARLSHGAKAITVVTMFLDIGHFKKGDVFLNYQGPYTYRRWMRTFCKITNPVVAFFEKDEDIDYFRSIRSHLPDHLTKVIKIHRNELPSFKLLHQVRDIYSDPTYPKHKPNTVSAEYTCAMHSKYDILERYSRENFFNTPYIAWVDIGYFRDFEDVGSIPFELRPPAYFDNSSVGFSLVNPYIHHHSVSKIIKGNKVWVAGGLVLAKKEVLVKFAAGYHRAVRQLLAQGLSNTDQQVIAAMYSESMRTDGMVKVQPFRCSEGQMGLQGARVRYFCLGFMCREQGLIWKNRISADMVAPHK